MATVQLTFREGTARDLADTFALAERALHEVAVRQGVMPEGVELTDATIRSHWLRQRNIVEFLAAQPGSRYWIAEAGDKIVGFARVVQFGQMEELTELMVDPEYQRQGVARALLERCWPGDPTPDLGRVVVATGAPADLTLYPDVRRHARHRPLARAGQHGALSRAARARGGRARPGHRRPVTGPRGRGVGAARGRRRSRTSARRCTSSSRATASAWPR